MSPTTLTLPFDAETVAVPRPVLAPPAAVSAERFSYIALCPSCGKIIAAMADSTPTDNPDYAKDLARETGSWIRKGFPVTRITSAEVRSGEWGFDCGKEGHFKKGGS